jgi:hypothetical protein
VKLTKKTPSSAIPGDIMARIYAAVAQDIFQTTTIGNPANVNRDVVTVVNKLFPQAGVLELPDSYESQAQGKEFLFFVAGMLIGSKVTNELQIALAGK